MTHNKTIRDLQLGDRISWTEPAPNSSGDLFAAAPRQREGAVIWKSLYGRVARVLADDGEPAELHASLQSSYGIQRLDEAEPQTDP